MILKQLKQLTLSATRRNAYLLRLPRLYTSPATVSQTVTTTSSKPSKRLSKDDRRLLVESFVSKYTAANAGKFPTVSATIREVGGGFYYVRNILQELQLRPNPPVSRVPASAANDASSLKQDHHTLESSHPSSDEVSLQGDNNSPVITATRDTSEAVTAPLDSRCGDGSTHLKLKVSEESLRKSETEEEGTLTSQEPRADHLQGANSLVIPATHDTSETVTLDSKCDDGSTHLTLKVSEESIRKSEAEEDVTLTQMASQEPKAERASVLPATHDNRETETSSPNDDADCKRDAATHLPGSQESKVSQESLKKSETEEEVILRHLGSQEPKAEGASVLPATHDNREKETAPNDDAADSKLDAATHLPGSQESKVSEECVKNSETEEEGILRHLGSQEPKADCHEGGATSANVLPTETRQVPEKGDDGEVKTGENSSAWSNIISFAKEFANFWRKG